VQRVTQIEYAFWAKAENGKNSCPNELLILTDLGCQDVLRGGRGGGGGGVKEAGQLKPA